MPKTEGALGVPPQTARKPLEGLALVVRELEMVAGHSLQEFREGIYVRRAAERLVQLGVDLACELGICMLVGRARNLKLEGYEETFCALGEKGIISVQLAEKLVSTAELRRRIVFASGNGAEDDLHRRLPFLAVLLKEYGRSAEKFFSSAQPGTRNAD